MKQITLDYETYKEELKKSYDDGLDMGIWQSLKYLEDRKNLFTAKETYSSVRLKTLIDTKYPV